MTPDMVISIPLKTLAWSPIILLTYTLLISLLFLFIGYKMGLKSVQPIIERYTAPLEDMGNTDLTDEPDYFLDRLYDPDENKEDRIETIKEG